MLCSFFLFDRIFVELSRASNLNLKIVILLVISVYQFSINQTWRVIYISFPLIKRDLWYFQFCLIFSCIVPNIARIFSFLVLTSIAKYACQLVDLFNKICHSTSFSMALHDARFSSTCWTRLSCLGLDLHTRSTISCNLRFHFIPSNALRLRPRKRKGKIITNLTSTQQVLRDHSSKIILVPLNAVEIQVFHWLYVKS